MQLNLPRGTIFLVAAVVAGLVATFGIHRYVSLKTRVGGSANPPGLHRHRRHFSRDGSLRDRW